MVIDFLKSMFAARRTANVRVSPIVIGATGGSGTRVVHGILREAGLFMGVDPRLNHAGDAMDIEPMLDRHINPILSAAGSLDYRIEDLPATLADAARADLLIGVGRFLGDLPSPAARWGWKNPRCMYILPLIHELFADLKFIHLVRDGRDMATSENQNQPRKHYEALFSEALDPDDPAGSLRLWAEANGAVADWGERMLAGNYLRIRFEDLCAAPSDGVTRIVEFAGFSAEQAESVRHRAASLVSPPDGLGRWRDLPHEVTDALTRQGANVLERFGYISDPDENEQSDTQ